MSFLKSRKIIITCAVTGGAEFNRAHPSFPITPEQIAQDCLAASEAGAAIVHIHTRDPSTGLGNTDTALFKEITDRIREKNSDLIINLTCGGLAMYHPHPDNDRIADKGSDVASAEERYAHIEACLPDICSLDMTTSNQIDSDKEVIYMNSPNTLRKMARRFIELNVKPELEVFEAGDIILAEQFIKEGLVKGTPMIQCVLGVKYNAPQLPCTIDYFQRIMPQPSVWTAMGVGSGQFKMAAVSVLNGGNVRVGLEDNLYLRKGEFASNKQLVRRAVELVDILGHEVATTHETREILGLTT